VFVIEDEIHAEWQGRYATFEDAIAELRRRSAVPWEQPPNLAPCTSHDTCGRQYVVIEFDVSFSPWKELKRTPVLEISASGVKWSSGFETSAGELP
jgi:hypothetical protein